ncbi:MAG: CatB-related O-acetyltransferase [Sideroxyarcus sp.]|nr:CatB-related O-acetyltransferase [Sideroxyarcus sp.]
MKNFLIKLYTGIRLRGRPQGRRISPLATLKGNVSIGKYSYVSGHADIRGIGSTTRIGSYCSVARGVKILSSGQIHGIDSISTYPFYLIDRALARADFMLHKGDVVIGNDVWIGADAIVMPGVSVGDGAVIGAGAVVTKDVEAFQIVAGVPARPVRKRFAEPVCAAIAASKWWERDYEELKPFVHLICAQDSRGDEGMLETLRMLARTRQHESD